jgi:hypothetical protein
VSVTFWNAGEVPNTGDGDVWEERFLNLSNANARDLIAWLRLPDEDLCGEIAARELAARCRRRLWDEARNHDEGLPGSVEYDGRLVIGGREPGYLRRRTEQLLNLCALAGEEGVITWG